MLFLIKIYPAQNYLNSLYNAIKHKKEEHYRSFRTTPSPPEPSQNIANQSAQNQLNSSLLSDIKPKQISQTKKTDSGSINNVKVQENKNELKLQVKLKS